MLPFCRSTVPSLINLPVSYVSLPSNDMNAWYYPSHGHDSDVDDDEVRFHPAVGNWGRKSAKEARWIRRGKQVPWGPGIEEWQVGPHHPHSSLTYSKQTSRLFRSRNMQGNVLN